MLTSISPGANTRLTRLSVDGEVVDNGSFPADTGSPAPGGLRDKVRTNNFECPIRAGKGRNNAI